ncbi:MAG: YfhO family protein, partial [Anaerolineales bacterium]
AYDRSDVSRVIRHRQAPVARSWPARSGFPPETHTGYTYRARFSLPDTLKLDAVEIRPLVPLAFVRIERLILVDDSGGRQQLSQLVNMGDHTLCYRSEDVAVYHNHGALPRVFVVHDAQAVPDDEEAIRMLRDLDFDPRAKVLLAAEKVVAGQPATMGVDRAELVTYDTRLVEVEVEAASGGYLVLTDAWYPGWRVWVDGQEAPLLRADLIFRAVRVDAGKHLVEFAYEPQSFRVGLLVSAAALLLLSALGMLGWLAGRPADV